MLASVRFVCLFSVVALLSGPSSSRFVLGSVLGRCFCFRIVRAFCRAVVGAHFRCALRSRLLFTVGVLLCVAPAFCRCGSCRLLLRCCVFFCRAVVAFEFSVAANCLRALYEPTRR